MCIRDRDTRQLLRLRLNPPRRHDRRARRTQTATRLRRMSLRWRRRVDPARIVRTLRHSRIIRQRMNQVHRGHMRGVRHGPSTVRRARITRAGALHSLPPQRTQQALHQLIRSDRCHTLRRILIEHRNSQHTEYQARGQISVAAATTKMRHPPRIAVDTHPLRSTAAARWPRHPQASPPRACHRPARMRRPSADRRSITT